MITDIKRNAARGYGEEVTALLNKVTNNDFTTRWEFIKNGERIVL